MRHRGIRNGRNGHHRRRAIGVIAVVLVSLVAATAAFAAGARHAAAVEITCMRCENSPTDPFLQSRYQVVQQFNKAYAGKYHIKVLKFGGRDENDLQYFQRLALAGSLPDIFVAQSTLLQSLSQTKKVLNLAPFLAGDKMWKGTFYPGAFSALTTGSKIWGIPEQRDVIGIYYNKALFKKAGIASFPKTWAQFETAVTKLKASGVIPFAMDGDWVTQLMWANLIGTQSGGSAFLTKTIRTGSYSKNPIAVKATEFLKALHADGYVNSDAFTGDYNNAMTPFVTEKAAMIANGPWMATGDIKGKSAAKGLSARVGYAPSPGWSASGQGAIVLAGNAGWASGTTRDAAKQKAVVAFMKFTTTPKIQLQRTIKTGAFWPVKMKLTKAQAKQLPAVTYNLVQMSGKLKYAYPHAKYATPQSFSDAWKNDWPAYVQGGMTTQEFLAALGKATKGA